MASEVRRRAGPPRPLFSVEEAARVTGARILPQSAAEAARSLVVSGVEVDSRQIRPGDLFCALAGEHVDGHDFVDRAWEAGAVAAMVSRGSMPGPPAGRVYLQVADTLKGLADLARHHRERYRPVVIGVTGSVGKTTTKDLIASVLGTSLKVLANPGNLNTDIGLPLTLFELGPEHQVACLEMGMRGPGEISRLAGLARPSIGVITNVGPVHIELLGSLEAIARAKEELLWSLPADGTAVLNADDPVTADMARRHRGRLAAVITYGLGPQAHVRAAELVTGPAGETLFRVEVAGDTGAARWRARAVGDLGVFSLPLAGRHVVLDALAAVATGLHLGLEPEAVRAGLARPRLSAMRQEVTEAAEVTVINDAYNAGPASMAAALQLLVATRRARGGRAVAVLGDMLELGHLSEKAHRDLGRLVGEAQVDYLVTVGPRSTLVAEEAVRAGLASDRVVHFGGSGGADQAGAEARAAAAGEVLRLVQPGDTVLIKASRGMKFEEIAGRILETLQRRAGGGPTAPPGSGRGGAA